MQPTTKTMAWLASGVLTLAVLSGCAEEDPAAPDTLRVGIVPSGEVERLVEHTDDLQARLGEELDRPVKVTVSEDYAALITAMQSGQVDVGMSGPIGIVQLMDAADAVPILQAVRFGAATYHTQWFTNDPDTYCLDEPVVVEDEGAGYSYCNGTDTAKTGPVGDAAVKKIRPGTAVSFTDQGSASGYYYPATQWGEATGHDPLADLKPIYSGDHDTSALAVADGKAPVGVSYDDVRTALIEDHPDLGTDITVFAYSTEIPNDGIAVSADVSDADRKAITGAFRAIAAEYDPEAADDADQGPLYALYSIEDLVPADIEALDAARQVALDFG